MINQKDKLYFDDRSKRQKLSERAVRMELVREPQDSDAAVQAVLNGQIQLVYSLENLLKIPCFCNVKIGLLQAHCVKL